MMPQAYAQALDLGHEPEPTLLYHPRWNQLTGSSAATLLLGHILYWWRRAGRRPFCKYAAPCPSAGPGTTWLEELGFSRRQFETARGKIAAKITRGVSKTEALQTHLVIYWTDRQHRTWYQVNEPLLLRRLTELQCPGASESHSHTYPDAQNEHQSAELVLRLSLRSANPVLAQWFQRPKTDAQTVHQITVARNAPLPRPPPLGDIRLPLAP
jgi:hypothetical protein